MEIVVKKYFDDPSFHDRLMRAGFASLDTPLKTADIYLAADIRQCLRRAVRKRPHFEDKNSSKQQMKMDILDKDESRIPKNLHV